MAYDEGLAERIRGILEDRSDVSEKTNTGRPMKGYLYVASEGLERDTDLERWVGHALRYVTSLPAKAARTPRASTRPRKR